jgi:50S ribosomal protein L16 3-hydroxylase
MRAQVANALQPLRWNRAGIDHFLGSFLTEPKPDIVFSRPRATSAAAFARRIAEVGVALDRRTQLLYDGDRFYVNGEEVPQPPDGSAAIRRLANRRSLPARDCAALPRPAIEILLGWYRHGYVAPRS